MKDVEVLADLITSISERTRSIVTGLSRAELAWRPDAQGNSIGVTVWHYSRWLDLLVIRLLKNKPAEEEQWHTQGWMTRTGYDPRGIGFGGLGAITGYTQKEGTSEEPDFREKHGSAEVVFMVRSLKMLSRFLYRQREQLGISSRLASIRQPECVFQTDARPIAEAKRSLQERPGGRFPTV
jgi:hypothetical protein